jgi:hypothetical protein
VNTYPAAGRNARTPKRSQCSTRDQPWPLCSPMVHPRSGTLPHPRNDRGEHRGRRLCSTVNTGAVSHTRRHRVVAAMTRRCNLCYLARACTSGHPGRGAGPAEGHTKCICMHVGSYISAPTRTIMHGRARMPPLQQANHGRPEGRTMTRRQTNLPWVECYTPISP